MPALGGGSTLRGFSSWRFQDRHALLLSAEWRVLVNRFLDTALFYDAGRVAAHRSDLSLDSVERDLGIGFRFHGYETTPLRIEVAHGREGWKLVFAAKGSF
jgi:hemolysin activation/secretion protein